MRFTRSLFVVALAALVVVPAALALRFTDDSYNPPVGTVDQAYTHWFRGDGGCGPALPYQFRILSGSLPPGLSLRKDGLVSGTPTDSGSWSFWVELSDENPPSASWCVPVTSQREFTIKVVGGGAAPAAPPLTITTSSATPGTVGVPYAFGLTADGGGTQTWSLVAGQLPSGLALNPASGTFTGTPTAAGTYTFTVRVRDGSRSDSKQLTIAVRDPLAMTAPAIPLEEVGVELLQPLRLVATGGTGAYTWKIESGTLPGGLSFDAATAEITGTPLAAGSYPVMVSATDTESRTATVSVTLVVKAVLAVRTRRLQVARVGRRYTAALITRDGVGPVTWRVVAGRFPVGIRLNRANGAITGRPRHAGLYNLTFEAMDALGVRKESTLELKILKAKAPLRP
jgi:large repetitive protein